MNSSSFKVHFGGPDCAPQALRNLLSQRVRDVPPGGSIDWSTYYFRDRKLAEDLAAARQRGVEVRIVMEGQPRTGRANDLVMRYLADPGALGASVRAIRMPATRLPFGMFRKHPRLHEKIYCFSHPAPTALVGSFNPSGDLTDDDPSIVRAIGDHHVAHNMLVEIQRPDIVQCLTDHVRALHRDGPWLPRRKDAIVTRDYDAGDTQIHFWPREGVHPVERLLNSHGAGSWVRIAASHISNPASVACLTRLAERGARVQIVAEHTQRRIPRSVERQLTAAGIAFSRIGADADVPMHLKFVLADGRQGRQAVFGSFNWTQNAYWLNHETAVITRDEGVFDTLDQRWQSLYRQ